jgi:hypothetical protein
LDRGRFSVTSLEKVGKYRLCNVLEGCREVLEAVVKLMTFACLVAGVLPALSPASAQTYDPRYPVCIHVYGDRIGDRIDCSFISLDQCAATASGLPATCLINPYYAPAKKVMPARHHRAQ